MNPKPALQEYDGDLYTLSYPSNYTFVQEGENTIGFAIRPETIGVLRLSVMEFDSVAICEEAFDSMNRKGTPKQLIDINGFNSWFYVEQKKFGNNDPLFYKEEHPMSMYFYFLRINRYIFGFSYRLPEFMEDKGQFDAEHPVIMEIIRSLKFRWVYQEK